VLSLLERRGFVATERIDDSVLHQPVDPLRREQTDRGDVFHFGGYNMQAATFPARKGPNTHRVAVVGESFVLGLPYYVPRGRSLNYGDISHWLEAEAEARFPSRRFEVINAGAGGRNSAGVLELVLTMLQVDPDIVIVATGNNEGIIAATAFNEVMHRWVVYRLLKKTLLPEPALNERPYLMVQNEDKDIIRRSFDKNIRSMVRAAKEQHVPIVLCTMPINLRYTNPFLVPRDDALRKGRELFAAGRFPEAIEALSESRQQAWAAKFIGDCLLSQGEFAHAKTMYRISVELNPLNRMRPSLNETLRRISGEEDVPLVDLEQAVEAQSANGIPDPSLFCDYCHMTWRGYELVARTMLNVLIERKLIQGGRDEPLPQPAALDLIHQRHWDELLNTRWERSACSLQADSLTAAFSGH
jgi:lysophospholipase L1-like esterase